MNPKPLSKIVNLALEEITYGGFSKLPSLAITGLLDDFQYAWIKRLNIPYKIEVLDVARVLCNGFNKEIFEMTRCKSIIEIRSRFSEYLSRFHNDDTRVIISLSFDGKKIHSEWVTLQKYLKANKISLAN